MRLKKTKIQKPQFKGLKNWAFKNSCATVDEGHIQLLQNSVF